MMNFTLVNFIIRIYSQSGTICSFVESSLTTYSTELSDFGNDEFHTSLVNFIIPIYSQSTTIYNFVESFLTTYSTELSGFGNDEIHINEFHHMYL